MVSSTPRPHFNLRGKTRYPLYRRLGGPQGRSRRAENLVPHRDSIPDRPVRTQSLYRLSYPGLPPELDVRIQHFLKLQKTQIRTGCFTSHTQPSIVIPATCDRTSQGLTDSPPDRLRILVLDVYLATFTKYNHFRNIHAAATVVPTRQKRLGHP